MPTYEYRCKECGEELEVVQSFTDDALTECPTCGGPLRKLFGNIGITFKGSGFYKTDNRAANGSKASKSDKDKSESKSESADSSSSESKPSDSKSSDSKSSDSSSGSKSSDSSSSSKSEAKSA